ncbi:PDZ domain-containing protein [Acidaminobacter sp. JC074]|uniref:S41 family peptidase n=1 Tax=Acidaminobacter sp. JC074 TaxID=2530199 RepID=UPI001F0E3A42|nr:S41 family peptidase [Acidaminobacter sp. JC074]MCH4887398.1 PDZ domain-containing protein [Acidaminobacter sp. JC074]
MKKKLIALLLIACLSLFSFAVFAEEDEDRVDLNKITELIQTIDKYYKDDISKSELVEGAYRGIVEQLDKHSKYYTEDEFQAFVKSLDGTLIGIGVYIEEIDSGIKVISPIEGSPANAAGIMSGDVITHVDGLKVTEISYQTAIDMIKGEPDTSVKITIDRNGTTLNFDITRAVISIPDVTYEILDNNIGYLKIIQFGDGVSVEVENAIVALTEQGMDFLIIDLRNNPGGYLSEVIEISEWFVDIEDDIVHVDYKAFEDESYYAKKPALDIPLCVLINNGSASASEILAGAIKYNERGTLIGETTYGKGTVQSLYTLLNDTAMKLTTAEYFAANETKVNGIGVEPDIYLPLKTEDELNTIAGFAPMIDKELSYYNITSLDVFGAQQRLKFLGYDIDLTGTYDQKTSQAIYSFQMSHNLISKYALYPETKNKLNEVIKSYLSEDPQLDKAIEILSGK